MSKHLNPETGEISNCRAKSPENCPFTKTAESMGIDNVHFETQEEASRKFEEIMKDYSDSFAIKKKPEIVLDPDEVEDKYSGNKGSWIPVEGAKVKNEETNEIYTIKISKSNGDKYGIARAYDNKGKEITRYVPGPPFSVVAGPNNQEFRDRLEQINLHRDTIRRIEEYQKDEERIVEKLNSLRGNLGNPVKMGMRLIDSSSSLEEGSITGANKDGSEYFEFRINRDGKFTPKIVAKSKLYNKILEASKTITKDEILELYKKYDKFKETGRKSRDKTLENDEKYFRTY